MVSGTLIAFFAAAPYVIAGVALFVGLNMLANWLGDRK